MAWSDIVNGIGGSVGLLSIGTNLLSSQRGEEGRALSQGIAQGMQFASQQAQEQRAERRLQLQEQQAQQRQRAIERERQAQQSWQEMVSGRDMPASSVAGGGSPLSAGALNTAQQVGGGQTQGAAFIPDDLRSLLASMDRETGQQLLTSRISNDRSFDQQRELVGYQSDLQSQRDAEQFRRQQALQQQQAALSAANRQPSVREQRYQMLVGSGIDPQRAAQIVGGAITSSRDPITGETSVVNLGDPSSSQPWQPIVPDATTSDYAAGDTSSTYGPGGALRNFGNALSEATGQGVWFQDQADAERTAEALNRDVRTALVSELGGRPSNLSLEQAERLLVAPNQFTAGAETNMAARRQQRELMNQRIEEAQSVVDGSGGRFTPQQRADAAQQLVNFRAIRDRLSSEIEESGTGLRPSYSTDNASTGTARRESRQDNASPGPAPEGVDSADWEYMTPEERSLWQ